MRGERGPDPAVGPCWAARPTEARTKPLPRRRLRVLRGLLLLLRILLRSPDRRRLVVQTRVVRSARRGRRAVSRGHRNSARKHLGWGAPAERVSRASVQLGGDLVKARLSVPGQVRALGEVL